MPRANAPRSAAPEPPPAARQPVALEDFAGLLQPLGPRLPLAVACSGGSDSLALALLADAWARSKGAAILALIVDHGLRPGSAAEAARVAGWLAARGIACRTLAWSGPKPRSNRAAAAREARYRLLAEACRECGIADLLLGHQQEDQAETFLLRLARGSGVDGLSGMAPVSRRHGIRLLRPLLGVPRQRLADTLMAAGQPWLEDPSNADPRYARSRIRRLLPLLAAEGLSPARLGGTAERLGRARAALEEATARLLDGAAVLSPSGHILLDPARLAEAPAELGLRALDHCLRVVGGAGCGPRLKRLERLHAELCGGAGLAAGRTLQGCRILPWRGQVLICREPAAVAGPVRLQAGRGLCWDNRFVVTAPAAPEAAAVSVGSLGAAGWRRIAPEVLPALRQAVPAAARSTLPALADAAGLLAVPHMGWFREPAAGAFEVRLEAHSAVFPFRSRTLPLSPAREHLC